MVYHIYVNTYDITNSSIIKCKLNYRVKEKVFSLNGKNKRNPLLQVIGLYG